MTRASGDLLSQDRAGSEYTVDLTPAPMATDATEQRAHDDDH
jgi:hypothetical protein